MELHNDIFFSESLYGGSPKGITTLGKKEVIELEHRKK